MAHHALIRWLITHIIRRERGKARLLRVAQVGVVEVELQVQHVRVAGSVEADAAFDGLLVFAGQALVHDDRGCEQHGVGGFRLGMRGQIFQVQREAAAAHALADFRVACARRGVVAAGAARAQRQNADEQENNSCAHLALPSAMPSMTVQAWYSRRVNASIDADQPPSSDARAAMEIAGNQRAYIAAEGCRPSAASMSVALPRVREIAVMST